MKYKIIKHGDTYINPVFCPECMSDAIILDKNELYHWFGPFKIGCDCDEYICKNCGCEFVSLNKKKIKIKDIEISELFGWIALITFILAVIFLSIALYDGAFNIFGILSVISFVVFIISLIIWIGDYC